MAEDERPGPGPGSEPRPGRVRDAVSVPGGAAAQPDPGQPAGVSPDRAAGSAVVIHGSDGRTGSEPALQDRVRVLINF